MPILIRRPDGPYYSQGDERAFFEWLRRIPGVQKVGGVGHELHIHARRRLSWRSLLELIALFYRYQGPMDQLAQFETASNQKSFRNPMMFWHTAVFGTRPRRLGRSKRASASTKRRR
jgi:hypothetical protein